MRALYSGCGRGASETAGGSFPGRQARLGTRRGHRHWAAAAAAGLTLAACLCGCVRGSVPVHLDDAKEAVVRYYEGGAYERDVRKAVAPALAIIARADPAESAKMAVVFDIDETALSTYEYQKAMDFGHYGAAWHEWLRRRRGTALPAVLEVYQAARAKGLAIFFVTGRREAFRADTEANLRAVGYEGWTELLMKPDAYSQRSVVPFKSGARAGIEARGYRILLNIGDQKSDFEGGHAEHTICLPNYIYRSP